MYIGNISGTGNWNNLQPYFLPNYFFLLEAETSYLGVGDLSIVECHIPESLYNLVSWVDYVDKQNKDRQQNNKIYKEASLQSCLVFGLSFYSIIFAH